ncbi:MAG: glycosyltransferase family 39 protein [Deltaproteobacteria bacterium]|nr:glycosyltransferase family 39 protein [Deltaproteobacteria bacterium]
MPSTFFIKPGAIVQRFFSRISARAWLVILAGLGLRVWVGLHTVIVNPDGALYIHQAMALYFKNWNSLKTCGLSFLSSYPVLIAAGYYLVHDWILSARLISLFFGTALLIPLYLMFKEWVRDDSAILSLLVFAVTPVLVSNSVELVRDPINWFFLSLGTFAVIRQAKTHSPWLLLIASLCFLAAIWARIEAVLFPAVTLGYLLCLKNNRRMINVLIFLSPLLVIMFFSIAGLMISGLSFNDLHRCHEIAGKFIEPIREYQKMAESLKSLAWSSPNPSMEFFLPEARNLIWLIALGTLLNRFLEAFFYPFVVFYVVGFFGIHHKIRSDSRLLYLAILTVSGLALLYMHTLQTWMLYYRFFGIVMIPGAIFCAFGIERLLNILTRRLSVQPATVFWVILLLIIGAGLPKNLKSPDLDKSVFIQIGETVFQNAPKSSGARIATSRHTQTWVSFYANIHLPGTAPCPLDPTNCWESFPDDPDQFYDHLRQNRQDFVLWEEKYWPFHDFTLSDPAVSKTYKELGRWYHRDTGKMILYAVSNTPDADGR